MKLNKKKKKKEVINMSNWVSLMWEKKGVVKKFYTDKAKQMKIGDFRE